MDESPCRNYNYFGGLTLFPVWDEHAEVVGMGLVTTFDDSHRVCKQM